MRFILKQSVLFTIYLFSTFQVFSQYTNSKTCIGGAGDEVIYPRYLGENSSSYNFKLNDGGSLYFFYSNSTDGNFAPNKGYNDLVAIKINNNGELAFSKNFGNSFFEDDFIVKQSKDSSKYYILQESHSNDSFNVNGYIGDITIQYKLMCIDNNGTVLWNEILYNAVNHIDNYSFSNYPNWFNVFIDQSDNCIVQYNKLGITANGRSYYNDSIIYSKIDKNGNTIWNKTITPFIIYNNSDSSFLIDTFYVGTTGFRNDFTETENKYILSANLSRHSPFQYRNVLYTLDKSNATISSILIDSSYSFKAIGIENKILTYGNFNKYVEDSSNTYSYFHYRKYDEQLNKIYERDIIYNIPFIFIPGFPSSYSKTTFCEAVPYFNDDSSKIWFSTSINTIGLGTYYGAPVSIESTTNTCANIINPETGNLLQVIDLNKKKSNFLLKEINKTFYYYSFDTINSTGIVDSATITAYNFEGTELRAKDNISGINGNFSANDISNIESSIVLYTNYSNSKFAFLVLDTLLNTIMRGFLDTTSYPHDYFSYAATKYNLHIVDTNRYVVLQSIWQDTISGCYPNTNNIVFSAFSKENILSDIKSNTLEKHLNIYPNPNNGNFTVDFHSKGNYPIVLNIFDVTGKVIFQDLLQHRDRSFIRISNTTLAAGLYTLQISNIYDNWISKILITK